MSWVEIEKERDILLRGRRRFETGVLLLLIEHLDMSRRVLDA